MGTRKTTGSKLVKADSVGRALIADIHRLVAEARSHVAATANATLTLLYWRIGRRVHADVLAGDRAAYGEQIVVSLSRQLEAEFSDGVLFHTMTGERSRLPKIQLRHVAAHTAWQ